MNLQQRLELLNWLSDYILSDSPGWLAAKEKASQKNGWFTLPFIDQAAQTIAQAYLQEGILANWAAQYAIAAENKAPKNVGIVMAGNIPLVGFHDFLCAFISGHRQTIKLSSKDDVLLKHLIQQLYDRNEETRDLIQFGEMLKGCDAYIATGSNNSARYFDYYFNKYPHIIRRNRTSVAILTGQETTLELEKLADDVHQYFGLGCRNVTKLYVPEQYDFIPLLQASRKYRYFEDHNKYKNNYDYSLALLILNKEYYMTNGSILLVESKSVFSPISRLNYEYYRDPNEVIDALAVKDVIQCIAGKGHIPFGQAQQPRIDDYVDGADTLQFLLKL